MGAGGVILAAAGAHSAPNAGVESAAYMLLFHAAAVLGGAALTQQALFWRPLMLVVLGAWIVGAALFSGDIAVRVFAPTGGTILIAAWLALAGAGICALLRHAG
jgi:uncharacterized membrane protein YgdD (TMEM256/DUF423 family)